MKKTLLFLIAATAMMMAGCSNDDFGGATQGMTLNATVEQPASRATMTEETDGNYQFSFTDNDKISVGNTTLTSDYYIFTKSGEKFSCATAKPAGSDVDWYAYFPGTRVSLDNQTGDLAGVANHYACAGKTAEVTTGANGLAISLTPKVAILRIVKVDNSSTPCDINITTTGGWISGMKAQSSVADFDVETSPSKVTLLSQTAAGVYYIAVPAGKQITIYNGGTKLKATKPAGLTAGKYYTVTTGPVSGEANATGVTEKVGWVQLWPGGPKFATQNVKDKMTFDDAANKTGDAYVWGKNWRTPTKEEMTLVNATLDGHFYSITPLHTTCQIDEESGVVGLRYTGIMPGYTKQSIFLPLEIDEGDLSVNYWTSTSEIKGYGTLLTVIATFQDNVYKIPGYFFHPMGYTTEGTKYNVRPVLAE